MDVWGGRELALAILTVGLGWVGFGLYVGLGLCCDDDIGSALFVDELGSLKRRPPGCSHL